MEDSEVHREVVQDYEDEIQHKEEDKEENKAETIGWLQVTVIVKTMSFIF